MSGDKNKYVPQKLWVHARSSQSRRSHGKRAERDRVTLSLAPIPPVELGRFNCRGEYVWPGMHNEDDNR